MIVRDNGIGIPAVTLSHIFDAFVQADTTWQRKQGGMGIGLSLVKEFVGLHGGNVEARSDGLCQGCKFIVRLPLAAAQGDQSLAMEEQTMALANAF